MHKNCAFSENDLKVLKLGDYVIICVFVSAKIHATFFFKIISSRNYFSIVG